MSRIPSAVLQQNGLTKQSIAQVPIDPLLVQEILSCLRSNDEQDITVGLRFAECLGSRPEFVHVAGSLLGSMAACIRELLSDRRPSIGIGAVGVLATFRQFYADYADLMISLFQSPDAQVRCETLSKADTFLSGAHLRHLLIFREDPTIAQTGSGEFRYALRDLALEAAERVAGRSFDCGVSSECREGLRVSWRRWTFFSSWLERVRWRASQV